MSWRVGETELVLLVLASMRASGFDSQGEQIRLGISRGQERPMVKVQPQL